MATAAAAKAAGPKEFNFLWEGRDKGGRVIRGELRSVSESAVSATLRRQGVTVKKAPVPVKVDKKKEAEARKKKEAAKKK